MKASQASTQDLRRVVEIALRETAELDKVEVELRAALDAGDDRLALALARRLVGLPPVRATL